MDYKFATDEQINEALSLSDSEAYSYFKSGEVIINEDDNRIYIVVEGLAYDPEELTSHQLMESIL